MALGTYSQLSVSVFRRLNRAADAAVFDDCIALAEAEVNRRLALKPVRPMHKRETTAIASEYVAQPAGVMDIDSLRVGDDVIASTSPQNLQAMADRDSTTGQPQFYTQIGTELRFWPAPDKSYDIVAVAWHRVPGLTSGAPSNWLLTDHPDVYLHGVLGHAFEEYFDPEAADRQGALFDAAIDKVLAAYPARPDNAPLRAENDVLPYRRAVLT